MNNNNELFVDSVESFITIFIIYLNIKNPHISINEKEKINSTFGFHNFKHQSYDASIKNLLNAFIFIINDDKKFHNEPIYINNLHQALSLCGYNRDINIVNKYISSKFKEVSDILKMI